VLRLIAEGKSTKEIAAKLDISVKTVETHRKQTMDKLDIHSITGLTKVLYPGGARFPVGSMDIVPAAYRHRHAINAGKTYALGFFEQPSG